MENPQQFIVDTLRYQKKRGKNVRKSQDSNVDFPNETSMAQAPFGVRSPLPLFHGEIKKKSNGDFIIPIILNGDFIITKSIIYPVSWMITIINHS